MSPYRVVEYTACHDRSWRVVRDVPTTREETFATCGSAALAKRIADLMNKAEAA